MQRESLGDVIAVSPQWKVGEGGASEKKSDVSCDVSYLRRKENCYEVGGMHVVDWML